MFAVVDATARVDISRALCVDASGNNVVIDLVCSEPGLPILACDISPHLFALIKLTGSANILLCCRWYPISHNYHLSKSSFRFKFIIFCFEESSLRV